MTALPARRLSPVLETRDVSVRRCGRSLLQRASITVDAGEFLVLLGDHGSGADTLLDVLSGVLEPDAGRVVVGAGADAAWLLARPTDGLDDAGARAVLTRCRSAAAGGRAVVATLASAEHAAAYASTVALFVAGRMLSWGTPAVALVPAIQLLGAARRMHPVE